MSNILDPSTVTEYVEYEVGEMTFPPAQVGGKESPFDCLTFYSGDSFNYQCTRRNGHTDAHVACSMTDVCATWPQD